MKKIYKLPEQIVSHIAAGEVIERPCFVVKELVENAIDAKADSIHVEIEKSGLQRIVVSDNGEGMDPEDLEICFQPHTTSKIKTQKDLAGIRTLGFRGEALGSIAAVSQLQINSRDKYHTAGTKISVKNGSQTGSAPVGMSVGTTVIVDNLFAQVPARRKFLKSERTEQRLITEMISRFALSHPNIHFFLSHNGRMIFDIPKKTSLIERIRIVLGNDTFTHLIPVHFQDSYVSISGFVSKPQLATAYTRKYFPIVNGRFVTDTMITRAVKTAYGNLLDALSFPVFILHLTIPPEIIDVNIHPRKEQISYTDQDLISESIAQSVRAALSDHNLLFQQVIHDRDKRSTETFTGIVLKDEVIPWQVQDIGVSDSNTVMQIHNLYIIVPTRRGLMLIDQHAAHERILYEQFKEEFEHHKKVLELYELPEAFSFNLPPDDTDLLLEYVTVFEKTGFELEHFKGTTFILRTVPALFQDRDYKQLIVEMVIEFSEHGKRSAPDILTDKILKYLACRGAIKAGDQLSDEECLRLLKKLEETKNNYTCPHGRPTRIEFVVKELDKLFGRK